MKTPLGLFHFLCQNDLREHFELAESPTGAQNEVDTSMDKDESHSQKLTHSSQDSRVIDAARVASMLLAQRETEFIDPYTCHDPMFEAVIHDLLILATMMGENAKDIMATSMKWYGNTMSDVWDVWTENNAEDWAERRRNWSLQVVSDFHSLYKDKKDPIDLMACLALLADQDKPGAHEKTSAEHRRAEGCEA